MRFLLKSVHYASLSRTDLFTLPCSREVRSSILPTESKLLAPAAALDIMQHAMAICDAGAGRHHPGSWSQELERYVEPLTISEHRPWLLQQFLSGPEYASYSVVHDGRLIAHCDNEAEASCLNYAHIGSPQVPSLPAARRPRAMTRVPAHVANVVLHSRHLTARKRCGADTAVDRGRLQGHAVDRPSLLRLHGGRQRRRQPVLHRVQSSHQARIPVLLGPCRGQTVHPSAVHAARQKTEYGSRPTD